MISLEKEIQVREETLAKKRTIEADIENIMVRMAELEIELVNRKADLDTTDWDRVESELEFLKSIVKKATPVVEEPVVEVKEPEVITPPVTEVKSEISTEEATVDIPVKKPVVEEEAAVEENVVVEGISTLEVKEEPIVAPITKEDSQTTTSTTHSAPTKSKIADPFGTTIGRINF